MERGSTGDNAIIAWDESADKFTMGTTTATGASTGDLTIAAGTLVADLEGDVTGDVTGNADTASALTPGRTIGGVAFTGAADINLPGVNAAGNQNTSGTAATVTGAAQTAITSVGTLTGLTVASSGKFLHYTNFRSFTGTNTDTGLGDAGEIIILDNGSAINYNITDNSTIAHPIGTSIMFFQKGAGQVWIKPVGSTVIRSKDSNQKLAGQYSSAVATKIATDEWILVGDLDS
jgi:hypothetical protein